MPGDDVIYSIWGKNKSLESYPAKIIGPNADDPDSLTNRDIGVFTRTGYLPVLGSNHSARPLPGTWRYRDEWGGETATEESNPAS
jgi:hypothetical protein